MLEEDLERVLRLWSEECQEARWLLDLMELLNKLAPLCCAAVSDVERCKKGMEFCAGMTAVEEQLSLHAISTGYRVLQNGCNKHHLTRTSILYF